MKTIVNNQNLSNQLSPLPVIKLHHEKYLRTALFRTCCKHSQIPEECTKEVKPIFECLLTTQIEKTQDHQLTIIGLFKLLKDNNLYVALTLLTNIFKKSCKCTNQLGRLQLDINSFHHMLHNQEVQRIYRKSIVPPLPTTVNQLFQRLYEGLERNKLMSRIKTETIHVKEQYSLYMRMMTLGQASGINSLPQHVTEKIDEASSSIKSPKQRDTIQFEGDLPSQQQIVDDDNQAYLDQLVDQAISRGKSLAGEQILHAQTLKSWKQVLPFNQSNQSKQIIDNKPEIKLLQKVNLPSYLKSFHETMMLKMSKVSKDKNFGKLNYLVEQTKLRSFKLPQIN